ncbi:MAG: electron transporter SenC [Rhodospirillaceae bacterium BRH_c57]|nr:MAG: electron transporter SenC [Rhodospirillaceae bacterium BRH_c57]
MRWLKTVAVILAVGLIALGGRYLLLSSHDPVGTTTTTGTAAIGGPFTLVNGDGKTVTEADFRGQYMLIYFGYTFCPDVCPSTLGTVGRALDMLPADKAAKIEPVFITVDPERDTPKMVGEYVSHFHPRFHGLSGSPEQVRAATQAYRVYAAKVEEDPNDPTAYLMDHSAIAYLMGPDGTFLTHLSHGLTAEQVAEIMNKRVE